ncbi:hypothetical protein LPJ78_002345 [Coemansia sp. RSA 989]|nr:hypothetical protein LPJ68_001625 [Coemansia sp. RSA 1086]KAJ1751357.1 hypothetical protein LPJ79_002138 [Coemansia sp. RSA 1821]KAJ1865850.1 hypothetical protein LPJ78_002345 [Coemansia sp. RSA 989]KAJ1873103.1 hypothetical protein LPJ55_002569 [Coemansia sp. RSA 990]KAJ2669878.1 hypothetical protein IWW42_004332 [Coemansia sp. RSA 1085]
MSTSPLLTAFQEAHSTLVTRANNGQPVYLGLVFKSYYLTTNSQFALAYFFLIVLGIAERLFSFGIDCIHDKPGQPWRIFPRACLYYVVTMIRYVLMIAIMYVYIPMFLVICLGLALGQILVEIIRYILMMRRIKRAQKDASGSSDSLKNVLIDDAMRTLPRQTNHINESCC